MEISEAIACCYKVMERSYSSEIEDQCSAWLETLLIIEKLGFNYVSVEGKHKPGILE